VSELKYFKSVDEEEEDEDEENNYYFPREEDKQSYSKEYSFQNRCLEPSYRTKIIPKNNHKSSAPTIVPKIYVCDEELNNCIDLSELRLNNDVSNLKKKYSLMSNIEIDENFSNCKNNCQCNNCKNNNCNGCSCGCGQEEIYEDPILKKLDKEIIKQTTNLIY
jgi:hypothetical protein